ncbi:anti-sigma-I factor RsgI family protein [Planococcus soli]|uniref:anti-sigma-I factor RsgI family protein n=1 Tax=Planococcus soli TaxID=2666072 RepID=UPI00115F3736|nr:hypothetical protein [Planococcus soli]
MRIQSGICIELNDDRSIFLVKNGGFVKGTPTGNPAIGEEASFYPVERKRAVRWQPVMAPVVAAIAAIALFMSVLVFPVEEAFSYVQVEINPGIELGINDRYEVVSIRDLNTDGNELIHELGEWENVSLQDVLNKVFELAVTEHTEQITITSVEEDSSKQDQSIKKVVMAVSSIVENDKVTIQMKEATREQWRQSKEDLVPVGQMIEKVETLKVKEEPEVQVPPKETQTVPDLKETEPASEPEKPSENNAGNHNQEKNETKETKSEKETTEKKPDVPKKSISPAAEKKADPPAAEKKNDKPSPKIEKQQKTPKQNGKAEETSKKIKNSPPAKQQKENSVPKEQPSDNKQKGKPEEADEERGNSEPPGQQKKKDASANSSAVKKEAHTPPGQEKKKEPAADNPGKEKQPEKKTNEQSPKKEATQENTEKE